MHSREHGCALERKCAYLAESCVPVRTHGLKLARPGRLRVACGRLCACSGGMAQRQRV